MTPTLTLPPLRGGSLPLPQAGEGSFFVPRPLAGEGGDPGEGRGSPGEGYFTDEKLVGTRNEFSTRALIGPSFSVSARLEIHSGSA